MDEIKGGSEIYLEPEKEVVKNAKGIAEASKDAEKYIFCVKYEAAEKAVVLSEVKRLECDVLKQSDSESCVTVRASMAQLAAIKSLNCIEQVEMAADSAALDNQSLKNGENMKLKDIKECIA